MKDSKSLERLSWASLGGNCGAVGDHFHMARKAIKAIANGELIASSIYESEPWGMIDQKPFLNQVVGFKANCDADYALEYVLEVERSAGRERVKKWGPRTLDIDLLSWPDRRCKTDRLSLPHPALSQRRFVLLPWSEIAPNMVPYGLEKSVATLLDACSDSSWVRLWQPPPSVSPRRD